MPVLIPLFSLAMASSTAGGAAQVRLAELLASADTIASITANDRSITFALDTGGEALEVVATIDAHGGVRALVVTDLGHATTECDGCGAFTWLGTALSDATAVTVLAVDAEGRVRLTTDRDDTYLVMPAHGRSATNMAVEARWAAAWDAT